jgi:hypothetical protein
LNIEGQGLSGTGNVTLTGNLDWSGSFIGGGGGSLTVASGATLNIVGTGNHILDVRTLQNNGTTNWQAASGIFTSNGGNFVNTATFNDQNDHTFYDNGLGGGFTNAATGTYTKSVGLGN